MDKITTERYEALMGHLTAAQVLMNDICDSIGSEPCMEVCPLYRSKGKPICDRLAGLR